MNAGQEYLDPEKSVLVSSPAGSGKTEKLARRYIGLLKEGPDVRKILCITFTEKAAGEMKQRILEILAREEPGLLEQIRPDVPLMRIFTFHSFCLKLLKRFSMELGVDPSLAVMDDLASQNLWNEAVYESLMAEKKAPSLFFEVMKEGGLRGWGTLRRALDELHKKRPYPELLATEGGRALGGAEKLLEIYQTCLKKYGEKKTARGVLDFDDLELLAYRALTMGPEWHNILFSFDEHTDHILVDEFQDTSTLQWKILKKLTEEWRSGMGAKREAGGTPTVFLVGDEKQSIYMFRGANVGMFQEARRSFGEWMGGECLILDAKENYRSLPAIVEFVNSLFGKIMPDAPLEPWLTRYSAFVAVREGEGKVELMLTGAGENTKETRAIEASALALKINSLVGRAEVYDGGTMRPCRYEDMAVLLRNRTHLSAFEAALRKEGIPFVVLKGIGFFDEPETALLREFVSLTVNPLDNYSLFCILRSPLFSVDYKTLSGLLPGRTPLIEKLRKAKAKKLKAAASLIDDWLGQARETPLPALIEQVLLDTRGWEIFGDRQRHANIKKFIAMVEQMEAEGLSPIEIREELLRQRGTEIAKANINAEGMDAVRIMTVHASKGLQFPIVFLPSMDEGIGPKSGPVAIDEEDDGEIVLCYEEDSRLRDKDEHFRKLKLKGMEEEKRLFYVATTRAQDSLVMLGSEKPARGQSRLGYLEEAFGDLKGSDVPFTVISEAEVLGGETSKAVPPAGARGFMDEPSYTEPLKYAPLKVWRDVTEDTAEGQRHGEHGGEIGRIMHSILEDISRGRLVPEDVEQRAGLLARAEAMEEPDKVAGRIMKDIRKLQKSGIMDEVVLPRNNSFAELPFVLEKGGVVFNGRIDRVVLTDDKALVYDYKTFPITDGEVPELREKYRAQLEIYSEAAGMLFRKKIEAFLLFTHTALMVRV